MDRSKRFSERHGYRNGDIPEIKVRTDAPRKLRGVLPIIAHEEGLPPKSMRHIVCRVLREPPDPDNWSEYPNIEREVQNHLDNCKWYEIYDIIEEIHKVLNNSGRISDADKFSDETNNLFIREGIGWQLVGGQIEIRGGEAFEAIVAKVKNVLKDSDRTTAQDEIHEAIRDLSRRPDPDITGAIQHAMAALECVARDVTGDPRATLGEIVKKSPGIIPQPLGDVVEKAWGFASEYGRHVREGRRPDFHEAELVVGVASVITTYLVRKALK